MTNERKPIKTFNVDTGVSSDFLRLTLTHDVTTLEALYDLVDNSIDAARESIMEQKYTQGSDGLPSDYSGYKIHIRIDEDSVRVVDNCFGMDEETLEKSALYTAKPSHHEYGIGGFGLGLKRSLLKMGSDFALSVDNGKLSFKALFNDKSIGGNLENKVSASEYKSQGRVKSFFSVSNLKPEIKTDLHDLRWFDNAAKGFSVRYGIYLSKGLQIILHNLVNHQFLKITPIAPSLRTDVKFLPKRKRLNIDGVEVVIESGIHSDYIFPREEGHSLSNNRALTDYFGIYFACNDRVVVSASTASEYGWSSKWHSEYNGFVCWVKFVSKDPNKLPWNTSKTSLRIDSSLFLRVKDKLQPIADNYRKEIKKRYLINGDSPLPPSKKPNGSTSTKNQKGVKQKPKSRPKPRPKIDLLRDRDILIDWRSCATIVPENRTKEFDIFAELCRLSSKETPISCVVMLRVFLETTAKQTSQGLNLKWKNLSSNSLAIAEKLHELDYISDPVKLLIKRYSKTDEGLFSVNNIQAQIHSTRFHPSKTMVNTYWTELDPFLAGCWRYIQDSDIS